jgi:thiamine-monophosphate kinase
MARRSYNSRVKVSEVGEFGLIRLLTAEFGIDYPPAAGAWPRPGLLVDVGDDAVVTERQSAAMVWTTDTMVAGVHFLPDRTPWEATGWKALAVNVSDIAAMGARPHLALVTLCLPADFEVDDAVDLYRGLHACAFEYDVVLGGGDIVRAPVFSVTVALSGLAFTTDLGVPAALTRGAARPGDLVAVSGSPGESAAGLTLLQRENGASTGGDALPGAVSRKLIDSHERPRARVSLGRAALEAGVRCGMDVSDGLLQDLGHISRASGVTIRVDAGAVPLSPELATAFPQEALRLALTGGEDYELVLIGSRVALDRVIAASETPVAIIGEVQAGEAAVRVEGAGVAFDSGPGGWDHFR